MTHTHNPQRSQFPAQHVAGGQEQTPLTPSMSPAATLGDLQAALAEETFIMEFVRLCSDAFKFQWHEANGGNLSYRMTDEEVDTFRSLITPEQDQTQPSSWHSMPLPAADIEAVAGSFFVVSASGCHFRSIACHLAETIGIVEISQAADAYRIVWGFTNGGKPTSEFACHLACHAARIRAGHKNCRVIYHAHPACTIALSKMLPVRSEAITSALWKALAESTVAFPEGVGMVDWKVPGSAELREASAQLMEHYPAVIWAHHGLIASGDSFDEAFGMVHTIEKAANIALELRHGHTATSSENKEAPDANSYRELSSKDIVALAQAYDLPLNTDLLD